MTHKTIEFLVEKERAYEAFKKGLDYLAQISSIKLDQILGKFKLAISASEAPIARLARFAAICRASDDCSNALGFLVHRHFS